MTVYILEQYYSERKLAYIYDLAVKKAHQRRGVGRLLIETIKDFCNKQGFEEIFVQAHKLDDFALDFYRSTRAEEEEVFHFYYKLNA